MKFWRVVARGGHVGTGKYKELIFFIKADTAIKASKKARYLPGVKHNRPEAIISVKEISEE